MPDHEVLSDRVCAECRKTFKAEEHHGICPECVEAHMADYDDAADDEEGDGLEDDFDCGLMSNGQCAKAGSEECDWSCPNRESELFAGSVANLAKQK